MIRSLLSIRLCAAAFGFSLCAATLAGAAPASSQPADQPDVVLQDGILAAVRAQPDGLLLQWRFFREPPAPISAMTADRDGAALPVKAIQPYPQPGDVSEALFLFDLTDRRRADSILKDKALALRMMTAMRAHHSLAIGYYGAKAYLLDPHWANANDVVDDLLSLAPLDEQPDRDGALLNAIVALGAQPATRRAIYVLTDGHDATPERRDAVIGAALHYGVSVSFLTVNATALRDVDASGLAEIAAGTGGQVVGAKDLPGFLRNPFRLLDSGGAVLFSTVSGLAPAGAPMHVRIVYGDRALDIGGAAPVGVPSRRPAMTRPRVAIAGGVAAAIALAILVWRFRSRLARTALAHAAAGLLGRLSGRRRALPATRPVSPTAQVKTPAPRTSGAPAPKLRGSDAKSGNRDGSPGLALERAADGVGALPPPAERIVPLDQLWSEMAQRLRRCANLPADHARLTPAELASRFSGGDRERFRRLIHEWYYPRHYGETQGVMPDDEARQVMDDLFRSGRM